MAQKSPAERIRQLVLDLFSQLDSVSATATALRETLLIRDGSYCGHCFECDRWQAVWFIEENEVKLYSADGKLLRALTPPRADHQFQQKAA